MGLPDIANSEKELYKMHFRFKNQLNYHSPVLLELTYFSQQRQVADYCNCNIVPSFFLKVKVIVTTFLPSLFIIQLIW